MSEIPQDNPQATDSGELRVEFLAPDDDTLYDLRDPKQWDEAKRICCVRSCLAEAAVRDTRVDRLYGQFEVEVALQNLGLGS